MTVSDTSQPRDAIRVVMVDDHPLVRAGIRATLAAQPDYRLVGEAENGAEALRLVQSLRPELLLMDLEMQGPPPQELVEECRRCCPELKVVVLSAHAHARYLGPLRPLGINGFVLKSEASESLLQALRVVVEGARWFSHAVSTQLLALAQEERQGGHGLTAREGQIYERMLLGKDNGSIAHELGVSKQTVRRYTTVIYEKLGVKNRVQAILTSDTDPA